MHQCHAPAPVHPAKLPATKAGMAEPRGLGTQRVRQGWTGLEPGVRVWTFSSSLMYSMAVSTTIGNLIVIMISILHIKNVFVRIRKPCS